MIAAHWPHGFPGARERGSEYSQRNSLFFGSVLQNIRGNLALRPTPDAVPMRPN